LPPLFTLAIANAKPRYMTSLRYRYVVGGLVLSKAAWAKLGEKQQKIVLEVCREWQPKIRASWRKETENGIAALAKAGVTIRESSAGELDAFAAAAAQTRDRQRKPNGVTQLLTFLVNAAAAP
jgi:TRAP-type C4-dicarboxylate transport system substrate-binding protein